MKLFTTLVWAALAVALPVGALQTAVQQVWAVPIIQRAEAFEAPTAAAPPTTATAAAQPHSQRHDHHAAADAADAKPWSPENGLERSFWTWVANTLHAFAIALLALVGLGLWTWRRGAGTSVLVLGLVVAGVGFVSLHLWPAMGLPAEIPGMDATRLGSRQGWWLLAAGSALAACALLLGSRAAWRWPLAAGLLALPFVLGAPQIATDPLAAHSAAAQATLRALGQQFIVVTHAIAVSLWLGLGLACGGVFVRWVRPLLALSAPALASD